MQTDKPTDPVVVYDPQTGELFEERVCGDRLLRWAYTGLGGGVARGLLYRHRWASRLLGAFCNSRFSRTRIEGFCRKLTIDLEEAVVPDGGYRSFNDFFCRALKPGRRPWEARDDCLSSPADCRALAFPSVDDGQRHFPVKGLRFSIETLLQAPAEHRRLIEPLLDGQVFVARLCPADYHRFHFPGAGARLADWRIDGRLDSVNPLPLRLGLRVFETNARQVSMLRLAHFGLCAFVEVGAFGVGGIVSTHNRDGFAKMDEKGCFTFGGSTIVLVLARDSARFREDLCAWSAKGIETRLKAGETIADSLHA